MRKTLLLLAAVALSASVSAQQFKAFSLNGQPQRNNAPLIAIPHVKKVAPAEGRFGCQPAPGRPLHV